MSFGSVVYSVLLQVYISPMKNYFLCFSEAFKTRLCSTSTFSNASSTAAHLWPSLQNQATKWGDRKLLLKTKPKPECR